MPYSEVKDIYKDVKKDKVLLLILRIFFGLVVLVSIIAIGIFIHHAVKDKPAKLFFGLAEINTVRTDTVYKLVQQKKDTITIIKEKGNDSYSSNNLNRQVARSSDTVVNIKTDVKGNKNHSINGNNINVGVNGDVINGIKQRHLTNAFFNEIISKIPSKDTNIKFYLSGGKEGLNYANEIYNALRLKGYNSITVTNWMDPSGFDKVDLEKVNEEFRIMIHPASNVE